MLVSLSIWLSICVSEGIPSYDCIYAMLPLLSNWCTTTSLLSINENTGMTESIFSSTSPCFCNFFQKYSNSSTPANRGYVLLSAIYSFDSYLHILVNKKVILFENREINFAPSSLIIRSKTFESHPDYLFVLS